MLSEKCTEVGRRIPVLRQNRGRLAAYTLVEIMVVVAIIGVLLGVAVPAWAKSRNAARVKACVSNLRQIDSAKAQWALEFGKVDTDIPTAANLTPFLRGNTMPRCPLDGTYRIRRVSRFPTCTYSSIGHTLNNLDLDDDALPE
jgi:prepilin-type N-terminal cleavage/methylation domain-containing protein